MTNTHEHTLPHAEFEAVAGRTKGFIICAGLDFEQGDTVMCLETGEGDQPTGRKIETEVTYITSPANHCALSPEALNGDFSVLSLDLLGEVVEA